jgi:hypothetical protein
MATTDMLNGPTSSLPTYNIKNNCSIFDQNTVERVNYLRQLLLAISFNHVFFDVVQDLRNMGRAYYNKNPRKFCSTIQLNPVEYFGGKHISVYLPSAGGVIDNSIQYVKMNYTTNTWLMRVLQNQQLPTCWSNRVIGGTGNCVNYSVPPNLAPFVLTPNEQVLYYYIKNADFFTRTLRLLTTSFYKWSEQIYVNYTLTFPADLYAGSWKERTYSVTGEFLKSVYSQYLRNSRISNPYKLPSPRTLHVTYNIFKVPIPNQANLQPNLTDENLTQNELTEIINDNSDSFII